MIICKIIITLWIIQTVLSVKGQETLTDQIDVDYLRPQFTNLQEELWQTVDESSKNDFKGNVRSEIYLLRKYETFGNEIKEQIPYDLMFDLEFPILEHVRSYISIHTDLKSINVLYETFRRFQKAQAGEEGSIPAEEAWMDLAKAILDDDENSVNKSLIAIDSIVNDEGLFANVLQHISANECQKEQSSQQILLHLYKLIALTQLKGYMLINFGYMLKTLYGEGNFSQESKMVQRMYKDQTENILNKAGDVIKKSSRDLWKCDPKNYIAGVSYEEITQLLQGYIENEVDLNNQGTCWENCNTYSYTKSHSCYQNLYCSKQKRCHGKVINCKYVESDFVVCPADRRKQKTRRYEYIHYLKYGTVYGRKRGCTQKETPVYSWWRWIFWHCSYCFCLCDEQGQDSDRYINLRPEFANVQNNMVVTGVRFIKHNRIIHLQIQEGRLLPRGNIDQNSIRWVPVENYSITDRGTVNGQDYHTLTWEKRAIDLDDVEADDGHIITGLQFKLTDFHVNLQISTAPFNFGTGKLVQPTDKNVLKSSSSKQRRTELKLTAPDIPVKSDFKSLPDSRTNQYIQFTNSDAVKDAAQTTVPFFDSQPVIPRQVVPLKGVGIFHKGRKNYGGFIAPKIITYDYSKHWQQNQDKI